MEKLLDVVNKILSGDIIVSALEFKSHYYVHFWTNAFGKYMNPLNLPFVFLNSTTTVLATMIV